MGSDRQPTLIASVSRALRLLEAVASSRQLPNASELASATNLAPSTAYHLLRTLVAEGYLEVTPDHRYALSGRIADVGQQGSAGTQRARVIEAMWRLRDDVRRPVYLVVVHDGMLGVEAVVDNHEARAIDQWVPFSDVPHATAVGKAAMAAMPEPVRTEFLRAVQLARLTPNTATDPDAILEECERIATGGDRHGVATDTEEYAPGVACLAHPVLAGGTVGAVGIDVAPRTARQPHELGTRLRHTAEEISRVLSL